MFFLQSISIISDSLLSNCYYSMNNTGPGGSYEPSRGYLEELMKENSLFRDESVPEYYFLEYETLLDSSDMRPANWCDFCRIYLFTPDNVAFY